RGLLVRFGGPIALQVLRRCRRHGSVLRRSGLALWLGLRAVADSGLGKIRRLCGTGVSRACELRGELGWLGRRGAQRRGESCGEQILRLELYDALELLRGRVLVPLDHVVVTAQEPG